MDRSWVIGKKPSRDLREVEIKNKVVGWEMTPGDALLFFKSLRRKVVTLFGYSTAYEDSNAMLDVVKETLKEFSPDTHLVNIGATRGGIGAAYPVAKSMGFLTTGIVSILAMEYADEISTSVDHICFITDKAWGGRVAGTDTLSPTSQAMVACSDIFIGIGGGEISRDEMLAGRKLGKPLQFHPAEASHEAMIARAKRAKQPMPTSFWGAAHTAMMADSKK